VLNFSRVDQNTTSASAGGIVNHGGTLILDHSKVGDNTAAGGGDGIASGTGGQRGPGSSILVLRFSEVSGNAANGGILTITFSQISRNKAAHGGGIFAVPGSPVTLKFTVAKNIPGNCVPPRTIPGCEG
jgi:hypothetical protein